MDIKKWTMCYKNIFLHLGMNGLPEAHVNGSFFRFQNFQMSSLLEPNGIRFQPKQVMFHLHQVSSLLVHNNGYNNGYSALTHVPKKYVP